MNDDPSESNPTCSEDSTLEDNMWNILSFVILHLKKGPFLVWPLGGFFFAFQLDLIGLRLSFLVMLFFPAKSVFGNLILLRFTLISLESLCKNKPPSIRIIAEAKKILLKNISGVFFTFCEINVMVWISLKLIPSGWDLLGLESWSTILVLGRQLILEEIWGSIQFYAFLCAWYFLISVCTIFFSLSWYFPCQCRGTNKNVTTMRGIGLE